MIQATFIRNQNGQYIGFDCIGHAGYAAAGEDIVCAGVSALVINTVNAIAHCTTETFSTDTDADTGKISFMLHKPAEHDATLFMDSLVLGLEGIQKEYGDGYIMLNFKEV